MVLPIVAYGHDILRQPCRDISAEYPRLQELISNMWQTLYVASGCGLAAPQVDHDIRLFIIDSKQTYESMDLRNRKQYYEDSTGIQETFINARITDRSEASWTYEEGCLSIPALAAEVERAWSITVEYLDRDFQPQTRSFSGSTARMIQHEYDHTEGILYLDYLKPLKRALFKSKLQKIADGKVKPKYPMKFAGH
jgi:peptide deformylase